MEEVTVERDPQQATTSREPATAHLEHSPNMENRKRQRFADSPTSIEKRLIPALNRLTGIRKLITEGSNKLNKADKTEILSTLDMLMGDYTNLMMEFTAIQTKAIVVEEITTGQREISKKLDELTIITRSLPITDPKLAPQLPPRRTFATVTSAGPPSKTLVVNGEPRQVPPRPQMVLFYPVVPEGKTSEELEKSLQKALNPRTDGFQVVRTRKIRGSGLALQTTSALGIANIKKAEAKLAEGGIRMVNPLGRLPKVVIYNVPMGDTTQDPALFEEIFVNNLEGRTKVSKEDHIRTMRRVSLFGRKDMGTMNMIITCHPDARKVLIDSGLCYLGWNACRTRDYLGATRCFKCHQYGHISKVCTQEKETCRS